MNTEVKKEKILSITKSIIDTNNSIDSITRLLEAFRAHVSGEIELDLDEINKLANNGYIQSCLSQAVENLTELNNGRSYKINEILEAEETL